jgi:hypothetical protein
VGHRGATGTALREGEGPRTKGRLTLVCALVLTILVAACGENANPTPSHAPNVPCGPSEVFTRHDHAHLTILIHGQIKTVPAFVGITATSICWLHTHDTSGIIHIEAGDRRAFTLGDFFAEWGQPLSQSTIDGERAGSGESVQATLNQLPEHGDLTAIVLSNHEDIVLQLGPPFLQLQPYVWPPGY